MRRGSPPSHHRRLGLLSCVAPLVGRFTDLLDFETSCDLLKGHASGRDFNCLLSSLGQATGFLHPSHINMPEVHKAIQAWRQRQHEALMPKLQEIAPPAGASCWDAGLNRAGAALIFNKNRFLQGAHLSCAAAELARAILVLQPASKGGDQPQMAAKCGRGHLTATLYQPGFAALRPDLKKAAVVAALGEQPPPFVLYLYGGHYSPLLTRAQSEVNAFPPRKLLKLAATAAAAARS